MGRQLRWFLPALLVVLGVRSLDAGTMSPATASLVVDGRSYDVPVIADACADDDSKTCYYIDNVQRGSEAEGFTAMISGDANPDPKVGYAIAVTDFGLPSIFGFTFTSPIVPTGPGTIARAEIGGGLNNSPGGLPSVTIAPIPGDPDGDGIGEIQVASVSTGGPFVNLGVDVGPGDSGPATGAGPGNEYESAPGVPYSAGPLAGPLGGPWTLLSVSAAFSLTGGGDGASLTGFAEVVIPEPSSVVLALIGAFFGCFMVIRRRFD